jgi:hypothetical protein
LKVAKAFRPNGTTPFEALDKAVGVDLAFWTGFQLATVRISEMPEPTDMKIRVTVKESAQLHASRNRPDV